MRLFSRGIVYPEAANFFEIFQKQTFLKKRLFYIIWILVYLFRM